MKTFIHRLMQKREYECKVDDVSSKNHSDNNVRSTDCRSRRRKLDINLLAPATPDCSCRYECLVSTAQAKLPNGYKAIYCANSSSSSPVYPKGRVNNSITSLSVAAPPPSFNTTLSAIEGCPIESRQYRAISLSPISCRYMGQK